LPPHQDFTFGKAPDHNQIRILGPVRQQTQLELSWSDCIILGLTPKVVLSGDYENSFGGAVMVGRKGELKLDKGIIVAQRHIHCSSPKAEKYGLRDGQIVAVKAIGDKSQKSKVKSQIYNSNLKPSTNPVPLRQITFHNVAVRIDPSFDWQMHIDVDEANAAGIRGIGEGKIII
jgi:putative phosphotransacetylase